MTELGALQWLSPFWAWLALPVGLLPLLIQRLGYRLRLGCLAATTFTLRLPSVSLARSARPDWTDDAADAPDAGDSRPAQGGALLMLGGALACAFLALGQPVREGQPLISEQRDEPVDAWLLVSTSISMVLDDYAPQGGIGDAPQGDIGDAPRGKTGDAKSTPPGQEDRMTMSKRLLDRFAAEFKGRRLGLIVLGEQPGVWLPLSADRHLVRHHLSRLRSTLGGRLSALGDGLALLAETDRTAADQAEQAEQARQPKQDRLADRVAIVITDAGLETGTLSPAQGLARAIDAGFSVYFIVLGKTRPMTADSSDNGLLHQRANLEQLESLLDQTARSRANSRANNKPPGAVFHAADESVVEQALAAIQARHRQPVPVIAARHQQIPLYPYPLGLGLILLALLVLRGAGWLSLGTQIGAPP